MGEFDGVQKIEKFLNPHDIFGFYIKQLLGLTYGLLPSKTTMCPET